MNYFTDDLAESFKKLGYIATVIDLSQSDFLIKLQEQINQHNVKCFVSFNGIGLPDLGQLATAVKIPFISFYVDAAIYHLDRLQFKSDYIKNIFIDRAEIEFANNILNQNAAYIPHGAFTQVSGGEENQAKEGIVFAGSMVNPDVFRQQWLSLGKALGVLFDTLLEYVSQKECFHIIEDVNYILKLKGFELTNEQRNRIYFKSMLVHRYIRSSRRLKVLAALKDYQVDIYGFGWENVVLQPKHIYHGGIDFIELIEKISKAQLLINVLPEFIYGGHERIFTSMYYGTAVVTNSNDYLMQIFKDGEDLVFYSMKDLRQLPDKIDLLLDDPAQLAAVSQAGKQNVADNHTWFNRAREIVKLIE